MKTSTRLLVTLAALLAAITVSTLASGAAAMAAPSDSPPIGTISNIPKVSVTVNPGTIALVGQTIEVDVAANWSDGSPIADGDVNLDLVGPAGTIHLAGDSVAQFNPLADWRYYYLVTAPGDATFQARYTPPAGTLGATASGSAVAHQRVGGYPGISLTLGKAIAGSSTPAAVALTLPPAGTAFPVGGTVRIDVDALGTLASCTPTRLSATAAACTASLPGSLKLGSHAVTATFADSPSYLGATFASAFTVVAAAGKSSAGGSGSGSTGTASGKPSVTPTPGLTQTAGSTQTAAATARKSEPSARVTPDALPAAAASATIPLWIEIVTGIMIIAFLLAAALVTVVILRSRRTRAAE